MLFHSGEKHKALENIELWESYVLGWRKDGDTVSIELEAVVLPEHPEYEKSTPDLWACYKRAVLHFFGVQSLQGFNNLVANKPAVDAAGEKDFGHIEEFQFTRTGDFIFSIELAGTLRFQAAEMTFEFSNL